MNENIFKGEISRAFEKISKYKDKFNAQDIKDIVDGTIKYPIELVEIIVANSDDSVKIYNEIIYVIIDKIYLKKINLDKLIELEKWQFSNISNNKTKIKFNQIHKNFIKFLINNYNLLAINEPEDLNLDTLSIMSNGGINSESDEDTDSICSDNQDKTFNTDDFDIFDNFDIFDDIKEMELPKYTKHQHQVEAINKLIETNFRSGIIAMIMGAGKSFIMLNAINEHLKIYTKQKEFVQNKPIYLICTDRTEILRSLFMVNLTNRIKKKYLDEKKIISNNSIFETDGFKKFYKAHIDSFDIDKNYIVKYQDEYWTWDLEKFASWKLNDIIDMSQFDLVENVICKDFNVDKINNRSNESKPIIFITNNDFLKSGEKFKQIDKKKLQLVFNDECHGVSGRYNYEMLKYFRTNSVNVIGLSATPSREGTKAKNNLLDIYGLDPENKETNKLNIIINYDMIKALEDGIVLPFYHIVVKPTVLNKKILLDSTDKEQVSLRTIIEQYVKNNPDLPYHKVISWVRKISHIKNNGLYYSYIQDILGKSYSIYRSYSGNGEANPIDEFGKFELEDSNSMLLCVNRGKEGSDIRHLDMGLFLDAVKSRSITVSLQTFGRVMRPDREKKKKVGYIVECVKIDETKSVEMLSVKKVLNYYKMILNLASLSESTEYYDKIIKLFANTEFDDESKEIIFNLGSVQSKLKLDVQITDWTKLKEFLGKEICTKLKLTKTQLFEKYIEIVKKQEGFKNPQSDFVKLYSKLNHLELGLPKNIYKEFPEIWEKKTWYDVLGFKKYCSIEEFRKFIKGKYPHIKIIDKDSYKQLYSKHSDKLPKYPLEYYKIDLVLKYNDLLKFDNKN
jgi:superfamily II DNA or RNA helicase